MEYIALGIGACSAGFIAWQDFWDREIHLFWLLLFGAAGIFFFQTQAGLFVWQHVASSFLLLSAMLLLLLFIVKKISKKPVLDRQIGWGDILMVYGLATWWETFDFLLFYSASLWIFSAVFLLLQFSGRWKKGAPIPLAGLWAIAFLLTFPFYYFSTTYIQHLCTRFLTLIINTFPY